MKIPSVKHVPSLAPPGAGLPKIERFVANLMIRWQARRTTREKAAALFAQERVAISELMRGVGELALQEPVLIKRLPGLEDSSRFWSLLMVVDHLRIVNEQITGVISCLSMGKMPKRAADIALVKPSPNVRPEVIAAFHEGCEKFIATVASVGDLKTALTFEHPWFGPMDAATWHFMTGFHMRLHRKQMELILANMPLDVLRSTGNRTRTCTDEST